MTSIEIEGLPEEPPMPDFDELSNLLEEANSAQASSREREMRISLHAWLCYHGGLFSEWGNGPSEVDASAVASSERMQTEGHYRWDSAVEARRNAMCSLQTQLGDDITPSPISFDVEGIALGYNLPGFSDIPKNTFRTFEQGFDGDAGCGYESWSEFCAYYRRLASYLVYDLEAVLILLEKLLPDYMNVINSAWVERQQNRHYRQPSIQILGVHCDRDRTVATALSSRELGRLVRIHGQITLLSPPKTQFSEAVYTCSRCEDPEFQLVRQNPYDDELLYPLPCSVQGHTGWKLLEPPESKTITIRRAHIQDPQVSSSDTAVIMVEFQQELSASIGPGEEVVLVGYVRSRPMDKSSKRDRNREVYLLVTGIESSSVQTDVSVLPEERSRVEEWAASRSFQERMAELTKSFAPHIIGRDYVKHALLLQQVGGSHRAKRSDIHVAMFGDPGTGKTELALAALGLSPASRYISAERATIPGMVGGMSTKAELFSTGDKRVIQPGVLASVGPGGIAVIDEAHFLDTRGKDLSTQLNTALETQEVPLAMVDGGKVTTKTPVLFAANPKKGDNTKFDPESNLTWAQQAGMADSTLSRIDVPLVMRDTLQDEAAEEERAISALRRLNGDFEDPSNTEHLLDTRFLQCFFSVARETTEIIIPKKIMTLIAKEQVRSRLNRSDGDSVSNRRINSIGRLACAAAKISFCDTVTKEHAEFAFSIMAKTLMDISPSASEGGLTSQQVNRDSAIWHALNTYYSITDKTQFSLEDLINGVIDCWVTVNEGTAPKRDTILQAITGFLSTGKRHTTNGGLKKVGNTWGFDND
jgi:DNA replicative helicase MCM subunit Mcm2 (Cdc46/Mcm family)